jgi:site-specific recombinase XerD
LKKIAEIAGIEKKLTSHIARHSFGYIAGDKIPMPVLQNLYRHSSILTTVNYQQSFTNKEADEAMDKVLGF